MARFFLKFADPRKGVPFAYARNPAYEAPAPDEAGADAQAISYNVQGLVEIVLEVVDIFAPDGDAHQLVGDAGLLAPAVAGPRSRPIGQPYRPPTGSPPRRRNPGPPGRRARRNG